MTNVIVITSRADIPTCNLHIYKMFDHLLENENFKSIQLEELYYKTAKDITDMFIEKFGEVPKNLVFFENMSTIKDLDIPCQVHINVIIDDIHHGGRIKKERSKSIPKISRILSTYGYCFSKFFPRGLPVYFFPHCAFIDIPFRENPIPNILVSGRLNPTIYPFRNKLHDMSRKNNKIRYSAPNCSYSITHDSPALRYGERYVMFLNNFLASFTCDALPSRPYIVAKHFEILSSGSLLLAGNPNTKRYFEKLGFRDREHYLSCSNSTVENVVEYILNPKNLDEINRIRRNGYNFVRSNHFYQNRANYLKKIFDNDVNRHDDGINGTVYYMEKI